MLAPRSRGQGGDAESSRLPDRRGGRRCQGEARDRQPQAFPDARGQGRALAGGVSQPRISEPQLHVLGEGELVGETARRAAAVERSDPPRGHRRAADRGAWHRPRGPRGSTAPPSRLGPSWRPARHREGLSDHRAGAFCACRACRRSAASGWCRRACRSER